MINLDYHVFDYSHLEFLVRYEMNIANAGRVYAFHQKPWVMVSKIHFLKCKKNSINKKKFEPKFDKLLNNTFYGKTREKHRNTKKHIFFQIYAQQIQS